MIFLNFVGTGENTESIKQRDKKNHFFTLNYKNHLTNNQKFVF